MGEATEPMDTATPMLTMVSTTARGPLRLSLRPRLRLTPGTPMAPTDWATAPMAMAIPMLTMVSTTARGPLMLSPSPRLMLTLTTGTTAMVPGPTTDMVWDTEDTALATGATTGDKFSVLRSTKQ